MSIAENPRNLLPGREFYSPFQARLEGRRAPFPSRDSRLPATCPGMSMNSPTSGWCCRAIISKGTAGDSMINELRPFTAVFNPTGAAHSTLIGPCGASLFTIELCPANLRHLDIRLPPRTAFDRGAGDLPGPAFACTPRSRRRPPTQLWWELMFSRCWEPLPD